MRSTRHWSWMACGAVLTLAGGAAASAQVPGEEFALELAAHGPMGEEAFAFKGDRVMVLHAEEGFETKLVKAAPYQAEAVTEVVQTLADGNRIVRKTSASVYRDGEGRTRRESRLAAIGPLLDSDDAPRTVFLSDPVAGTRYHLDLDDKVAYKLPGTPRFEGVARHRGGPGDDRVVFKHRMGVPGDKLRFKKELEGKSERLGTQVIEGVEAEGTRTRHVIEAGELGNERPIEIVSERWYSPELQAVVMSRRSDPRFGETTYRLTNLTRGEPDRALFDVPADFKLSDDPPHKRIRRVIKDGHPD